MLIGLLAKTGQDQHLKLSRQNHFLFLKDFLDKKYSKLRMQMFMAGTN